MTLSERQASPQCAAHLIRHAAQHLAARLNGRRHRATEEEEVVGHQAQVRMGLEMCQIYPAKLWENNLTTWTFMGIY